MEPTPNQSDIDSPRKESKRFFALRWFNRARLNKLKRQHVIAALVILAVIIGLVTWQVIRANEESMWSRATDYFQKADYGKAEKELKNVAIPSDKDRLHVYAQTMLATQNFDKSLAAYKKYYELDKDHSTKNIIGNIYNQQKKYDEAIKIYRELIASNPNFVQAYINLSTVYKLQGDMDKAVETADQAVENNPSSIPLHELRVSMLMEDKSSADYKAAVAELKNISPADPLLQSLNEI